MAITGASGAVYGVRLVHRLLSSDVATEGSFEWVTGEPVTGYVNWNSGEPDPTTREAEDCLEMRPGGVWNDTRCTAVRAYVCERD